MFWLLSEVQGLESARHLATLDHSAVYCAVRETDPHVRVREGRDFRVLVNRNLPGDVVLLPL
jgi:hypothetical protein